MYRRSRVLPARFARFILAAGLAAAITVPAAQTRSIEHFTAFAIGIGIPGPTGAGTVDITINRWSTDAERSRLLTTLSEQGPQRLLDVLRDTPAVGNIRTPDSIGYDLHYARRTPISDGAERIVLVTDRPVSFWEAANRPRVSDYPFTVIEMHIAPNGKGEGKMSFATKITMDSDKSTIVLENYATQPILLNEIRRMK